MLFKQMLRMYYVGIGFRNMSHVSKSHLAKLRKKTGYTFTNCKKALEIHDNDLEKAERWLIDQAQSLGWSKATKLDGRLTAQGLVGVLLEKDCAAMVEVNCETDFVARNEHFYGIVGKAAKACVNFTRSQPVKFPFTKLLLDSDQLRDLPTMQGTRLYDELALVIGSVGENLSLRRAACFRAANGICLNGYAHPLQSTSTNLFLGKYGAVIAVQETRQAPDSSSVDSISRDLCQHIVGMNPQKVGFEEEDKPSNNPDEEQCLIFQEYLLDPTQTVSQRMSDTGITVLDFVRFECGEDLGNTGMQPCGHAVLHVALEEAG